LDEVRNLIQTSESAKKAIRLIGKVPHELLQEWYSSADYIISGSHYEGGGIGICEAMSCGCIPIVTDISSFRGMTGSGKCGLLYEPGNEGALLAALLQTPDLDIEKERSGVIEQFNRELSFWAIGSKINKIIEAL